MHLLAQYVRQSRMTAEAVAAQHLLRTSQMRVAINLLTDDPANPSGAHWFWTRIIPEMANLLAGTKSSGCWSARSPVRLTRVTGRRLATSRFRGRTRTRKCAR